MYIQEKQPQRSWPKDQIWSFRSSPKFFGSPMLDTVKNHYTGQKDGSLVESWNTDPRPCETVNSCILWRSGQRLPFETPIIRYRTVIIQSCLPLLECGSVIINPSRFSLCLFSVIIVYSFLDLWILIHWL